MAWRETLLTRLGSGGLAGITLGRWLRMLWDNSFSVDWPYWGRAIVITVGSIPNTMTAVWENWLYRRKIAAAKIQPPLIILGIWRSGTTHLHNLLARDDRFAFPNTYQVFFPETFLCSEKSNAKLLNFFFPRIRPQDNVAFGVAEPQEDEFALCCLTGKGVAMSWAFPRRAGYYDRFLSLRTAAPAEVAEWQSALKWFVRKLSFKYDKPLILKSPGHTGRIKVLLEMFPDARFVHIHRNPYEVFRSTQHMVRKVMPIWTLQHPDGANADERILRQYKEVYDAFFEEKSLIPQGHFHEVSFEDLEADPLGQIREIYQALDLPDFQAAEPALRKYVASVADYQKNKPTEIPAETKSKIAREWQRCFEEWGYP